MLFFSLTFLWSICLINAVFDSNKDISDIPFLMCQVLIQSPMPLTIPVLAFKISLLFSLNFGPLQKLLYVHGLCLHIVIIYQYIVNFLCSLKLHQH